MRLTEQILLLIMFGKEYFSGLGGIVKKPYNYGDILAADDRGVRRALTRMVNNGELLKTKGSEPLYRVTRKGRNRLRELRPYLFKKPWDKKWRLAVFDVPERYRGIRTVLRRFLLSMGFSQWQRSMWISPFRVSLEVREFIKASQLRGMAYLLEVSKVYGLSDRDVARVVWDLERLNKEYQDFAQTCLQAERANGVIKRRFVGLLVKDPLLPEVLLDRDFARRAAMKAYGGLVKRSE